MHTNRRYVMGSIVGAVLVATLSVAGMLLVVSGRITIPFSLEAAQTTATVTSSPMPDHPVVQGTVVNIRYIGSTFTVQRNDTGNDVTVRVTEMTQFTGTATSFSDLQTGVQVRVQGQTRSDGSLSASVVQVTGS